MCNLAGLNDDLKKAVDPQRARLSGRYFKTGKGEYGEGDVFLGIKVPVQRQIAKKYVGLDLSDIEKLLKSEIHEHRLTGLIILCAKYKKADEKGKKEIFDLYLKNTAGINNWDLVDTSAPNIVGAHLLNRSRKILYSLAVSKNLWERRIAILAVFAFIRNNDFADALALAKILLSDKHDLIHKAVGWMLREIGNRNREVEEGFLNENHSKIPRTALRYAIEKFDPAKRKRYLGKSAK